MNAFDIAAILVTIAAVFGYVNHRVLRLPATSGTLAVALITSLLILAAGAFFPRLGLEQTIAGFLGAIDFNETLMHGMLSFLLFAGALHVDVDCLLDNVETVGVLSTVGVVLSTAIVGILTFAAFALVGVPLPLVSCLAFGALISPTDPIAVMGLLKELRAPKTLESQIAGESLFNDGVGVVVFFAVVSYSGPGALATFFVREVAGGAVLGLALGYLAYRALKTLDEHDLELLITLALAMFTYALAFWIGVSGPIAVVVAGILIGNQGRQFAMSARTREHVDAFWGMLDEVLNAVLFLLLGLEVVIVSAAPRTLAAGLLAIPIVLLARLVSVGLPVAAMTFRRRFARGIIPVLTWSGLRGGLSVAMVLSLPAALPGRRVLLAATYGVVVFSILVQGLTTRRLLIYYDVGEPG